MSNNLDVAILGSGDAGISLAGTLALRKFNVSLAELPKFENNLQPILKNDGITVSGNFKNGIAKPEIITTDIKKAIQGRKVIFFCTPAYGHEAFTKACAPHLENGQILVYISYFGAKRMDRLLKRQRIEAKITLSELLGCSYVGRKITPSEVFIKKRKSGLPFSAFPGCKTQETLDTLKSLFGNLIPAKNCLETSINNTNTWVHAIGAILNTGWIESTKGSFNFLKEGLSPATERVQRAMDEERIKVDEALGLPSLSWWELMDRFYKDVEENPNKSSTKLQNNAPKSVKHRYIVEDVKYGLVPVASIAREIGISMPVTEAVIRLASIIAEESFSKNGPDANSLGISGLSPAAMNDVFENP